MDEAATSQRTTKSRHPKLSLADAVGKIRAAAETIQIRGTIKQNERKRIEEAFETLIKPQETLANQSWEDYSRLLTRIYNAGGVQLVAVCIVGLGKYTLRNLRENVQLRLHTEIEKYRREWDDPIIQSLAQGCWNEVQSRTDSHDEPCEAVVVAEAAMLDGILGPFLSTGMRLSCTRLKEDLQSRLTKAVRLLLPLQEGEDIMLEILVHSSFGECVLAAKQLSVEELRGLLGEYLFTAMKASKRRKEEEAIEESIPTRSVQVLQDDSGDKKLRVTVNFGTGVIVWGVAFSPLS